ncbi:7602_t:CDS:2 [Diversispora eburnea]|uniref:7602_t:CDS:1 n=1 Tax=Diversispora eburnea TaxID=1213867 RepID=A0A9N9A878_9GLOM|nr:7602_t:CDS:2 [Diversispora eburnea]
MNITEEKWSIQQSQVPPSPHHHTHPTMSPQMNGMPSENFMQPFQYDGQQAPGQMHPQIFVSMAAPALPSRNNVSPINSANPNSSGNATDRKVIDNRPTFTTSSFHAAPFQQGVIRKRRTDAMGFPQDAGPFFSATSQHYNVYTDNDWTCYRRNYFQISSAFSISSTTHPINETDAPCLLEVDGQFHTVTQFLLGITARVSNSDKKIELVQHTPKRDKGPQMVPVPKPIRAGGNLNLSSVGSNSNIVTFERIQFKTATANNGKRRAAQQYYVVLVDLYAQTETGEQFRVATSTSAPLVVRGRSPGHYADNHDRYNPMAMNPAFPNDRHIGYPPQGPNGAPMMPPDFNGAPFQGPYGQYPPFTGFPPVAGGLMMATAPNGQSASPFHPQHPHAAAAAAAQQYMVQGMQQDSGENQNSQSQQPPEMYNDSMMHMEGVTTSSSHSAFTSFESRQGTNSNSTNNANVTNATNNTTTSTVTGGTGGNKPYMKIEIPQSSELPDHPLTSPAYHTQEYVDANNASSHHGGYHSDHEPTNNNNNGGGRQTRSEVSLEHNSSNTNGHHSPQMNVEKTEPNIKSPTANNSMSS